MAIDYNVLPRPLRSVFDMRVIGDVGLYMLVVAVSKPV
jgi:hypothetical protein